MDLDVLLANDKSHAQLRHASLTELPAQTLLIFKNLSLKIHDFTLTCMNMFKIWKASYTKPFLILQTLCDLSIFQKP